MEHLHHSLLILLMVCAAGYFVLDRVLVAYSSVRFGVYYAAFCAIATSMVMMILR
jgi:hypothetical protein